MSVNIQLMKDSYNCDGSANVFPMTFQTGDEAHVLVIHYDSEEERETILDMGDDKDYTISGTAPNFSVNTALVYPEGDKIAIAGDIPLDQLRNMIDGGRVPPTEIMIALDKLTMICQQQDDKLSRCIQISPIDGGTEGLTLPNKEIRADRYLSFDENGNPQAYSGLLPRVYDDKYPYLEKDIIQVGGLFYIARKDHSGHVPGGLDNEHWKNLNFEGIKWTELIVFDKGETVEHLGYLFKSNFDKNYQNVPGEGDEWEPIQTSLGYDSGFKYKSGLTCSLNGFIFISIQDNNKGHQPTQVHPDLWWEQLKTDITYYPTIRFKKDQQCEYSGYLFKSIEDDNKGNVPGIPDGDDNWTRLFSKGDNGEINPFIPGGNYSNDTIVTVGKDFYISEHDDNEGNTPSPSSTHWSFWPKKIMVPTSEPDESHDGMIWMDP